MNRAEALAMVKAAPMAHAALCIKTHHVRIPADVCCKPNTDTHAKSCGDISHPVDMHGLRRALPHRWADFCQRHFRNSVEVAAFFDTDEKTARNWLEGKHAPSSAFTLRAVAAFPDAVHVLLGDE